jgi:hypothetical protein
MLALCDCSDPWLFYALMLFKARMGFKFVIRAAIINNNLGNFMTRHLLIIDPLSTSQQLIQLLHKTGASLLIMFSQAGFPQTLYGKDITPDIELHGGESIEEVLALLAPYQISAVIPGHDTAVFLADIIADKLGIPHNKLALSKARRDKFHTIEALHAADVPAAKQILAKNAEEIITWAKKEKIKPVIVKPCLSAASDDVFICHNDKEIKKSCEIIIQDKNIFSEKNEDVLAQEFLNGDEYIVNTVSWEGQHMITDVWKSEKEWINNQPLYKTMALLPSTDGLLNVLIPYAIKVLNAAGFEYGPAHLEIMVYNNEAKLVELNSRLMGLDISPGLLKSALERTQVEACAMAYANPEVFLSKVNSKYFLIKNLSLYFLKVRDEGLKLNQRQSERFAELKSHIGTKIKFEPGEEIPVTDDLITSPGYIVLANTDAEQLHKDLKACETIEKELYI